METKQNIETPNSVEISVNAKQKYSGKVKVYGDTIDNAMEQALIKSAELQRLISIKNGDE